MIETRMIKWSLPTQEREPSLLEWWRGKNEEWTNEEDTEIGCCEKDNGCYYMKFEKERKLLPP